MTLKVKLVHENAKLPTRNNPTDAGLDLYATEKVIVQGNSYATVDFGIQIALPPSTCGLLFARSGLASKDGIKPRNCVGVIDQPYRGNIMVTLYNDTTEDYTVEQGDRVAQLVIAPIYTHRARVVYDLDQTDRGCGGFGSSGR